MKNKFIILTLCFTIIFTNINLNNYNSYANNIDSLVVDGGVVTAPMVAVVATVALACGVALNDDSDLYDVAYIFYEKYKDNQEIIKNAFDVGVSILENKVVNVSKEFIEFIKSAFDDYSSSVSNDSFYIDGFGFSEPIKLVGYSSDTIEVIQGSLSLLYNKSSYAVYYNGVEIVSAMYGGMGSYVDMAQFVLVNGIPHIRFYHSTSNGRLSEFALSIPNYNSMPGFKDYNYDNIADKVDQGSVGLYMPGYLGDLIGKKPSDVVYDGVNTSPYDKPYDDSISLPGVNNPSLDIPIDGVFNPSTDVPGVENPSVPNDGIWENIKDFIISLVVPSDTFWTDTFNGFRDNLNSNFPMLDMSPFDSLLVGGKPFPDLYAYGSVVVNGKVINSIVDWLRPIIAGFIMLCLMFFNYRKIYKLIRNSEPFGNISPGTSDFSTGLNSSGLSSDDIARIVSDAKKEVERRTYRR